MPLCLVGFLKAAAGGTCPKDQQLQKKLSLVWMSRAYIYLYIYIIFFWSSCRENPTNCGRKPWMRPLSFHPGSTNLGPVTCWGCKGTPEDESCCASCGEQGAFVCWPLRRGWGDEGFWGTLGENRCLGTKPGFPKMWVPQNRRYMLLKPIIGEYIEETSKSWLHAL